MNPRPSRERRHKSPVSPPSDWQISIHAPRGRGDQSLTMGYYLGILFQSTPLAGGATGGSSKYFCGSAFQSTPLAGGATVSDLGRLPIGTDFNPRPSREGRRFVDRFKNIHESFQSTPLAGGATPETDRTLQSIVFQSTPLAGGATADPTQHGA